MPNDTNILLAALSRVKELETLYGDSIPWSAIHSGFTYSGEQVLLANLPKGIFKPKIMSRGPISIKTTMPRGDAENIYNDQLTDEGYYQYSLEAGDPRGERNVLLWQALKDQSPFIYFHAVSPAIYKALWPCYVRNIHSDKGFAEIIIGKSLLGDVVDVQYELPDEFESKYLVRETKTRLHQASFREAVLGAYKNKCAITGLPVPQLLEAAHIIPDAKVGNVQTVSNGLALSRIHHRAYDAELIGIDPDYKIHVSEKLFIDEGGPLLNKGILDFDGNKLFIPRQSNLRPNRDYLAERYDLYIKEQ